MAKAFGKTVEEVREGALAIELQERMRQLVEAVRGTQKSGSLTLKLTLKPMSKGLDVLVLHDEIKLVLPEPERESTTVMFPTEENELTRRDPRQPSLPTMGVVTRMAAGERTEGANG